MQPLGTVELYLNIFIAIWFPLLILANLVNWGARSPVNAYLWREEPTLMRASMVIIAVLAVWSMIRLAAHFGFLTGETLNTVMIVIGVPFGIAAVVEIWLGVRALLRYLRRRPGSASQ
jgi:hypothetical protein